MKRILVPMVGAVLTNWVLLVSMTHPPSDVAVAEIAPFPDPVPLPDPPEPPPPLPPMPTPPSPQQTPPVPIPPTPLPTPRPNLITLQPVPPPLLDPQPMPDPIPSPVHTLVFEPSDVDEPPLLLSFQCEYPNHVWRETEGVVQVRLTVLEDGSVKDIEILSAKPKDVFDEPALECVSNWTYKPALIDGKPVRCRRSGEVKFESAR